MAEKFLYLLGAGASAQALPLVKLDTDWSPSLPKAMETMVDQIGKDIDDDKFSDNSHVEFLEEFLEKLIWLSKESKNFGTIDTYAKYLYIKNKELYEQLKFTLSVYFSFAQLRSGRIDRRYIGWITSILDKQLFPENIKILNWNYDFQMQLAAEKLFSEEALAYSDTILKHSPPFIRYYPSSGRDITVIPSEISLLHLNGIAGFYKYSNIHQPVFIKHKMNDDWKFIDNFISDKNYNRLNFAWERHFDTSKLDVLNALAQDVSILVVIGYSFPFFNRDVDKVIFKKLTESGKLRKIYFQDPFRDGQFLISQFQLNSNRIAIENIKTTDAFYIPHEM